MTRREFLKGGAAAVAPFLLPEKVWANPPSRRIATAWIGHGMKGHRDMIGWAYDTDLIGVCDVNMKRAEYGAAASNLIGGCKRCKAYRDFRELLADKAVDAVAICTPDHWHAAIACEAMRRGKDVFCEPPIAFNATEAQAVVATEKATGRIFQANLHQREMEEFVTAAELVRAGAIGEVRHVDCGILGPSRPPRDCWNAANAATELVKCPDWLDFDLWCGPAPLVRYNAEFLAQPEARGYHYMKWTMHDWFGTGFCGEWGVGHMDAILRALDERGPVKVTASREPKVAFSDEGRDIPEEFRAKSLACNCGGRAQWGAKFAFAGGCTMEHVKAGAWGAVFYGTEGIVAVNRGRFGLWLGKGAAPDAKLRKALEENDVKGMTCVSCLRGGLAWSCGNWSADGRCNLDFDKPNGKTVANAVALARKYTFGAGEAETGRTLERVGTGTMSGEFLAAVKSRRACSAPASVAARSTVLCDLCNLSYRHGQDFDWDPRANAFAHGTGDPKWIMRENERKI